MRFVVTGNIGCGKSTVVNMLRDMLPEHTVFDFDKMVNQLYGNPEVELLLLVNFGSSDKKTISDIVFKDPAQMKKVEQIMNGQIEKHVDDAFQLDNVIIDMPLFFEYFDRYRSQVDGVVCVTCLPEKQRNRIRSRNGFSDEKIDAILAKQLTQEEKARRSDVVIDNSGNLDDLRKQVVSFAQRGFR